MLETLFHILIPEGSLCTFACKKSCPEGTPSFGWPWFALQVSLLTTLHKQDLTCIPVLQPQGTGDTRSVTMECLVCLRSVRCSTLH